MFKIFNVIKRILIMSIILITISFFVMPLKSVFAATYYTQTVKTGIDKFPAEYQDALKKLKELHPNWNFDAYYTGLDWNTVVLNEKVCKRNRVLKSSDESWKCSCGNVASGYACASEKIISYYLDPRNFLNEVNIFQFLEISYNERIHNVDGVKKAVKNTFLSKNVTYKNGNGEKQNYKIENEIIKITPNTKLTDIDKNAKGELKTGAKVTVNGKEYTAIVMGDINGDGKVNSADALEILKYSAELINLNNNAIEAGKINGKVNALSALSVLKYSAGVEDISFSSSDGKEYTKSYAEIILEAAKESNMSPYSIASKIIQEVGTKGSNSVSGTYKGYEGYYNFYNLGAYDTGNAIVNGLMYAKDKGWNNQYTAIIEGAKELANSYTNAGQNTAYFYKWDVVGTRILKAGETQTVSSSNMFWHQYMTNVQDPTSQSKSLFNTYGNNKLLDESLNFIIPVYNNMPNSNTMPSGLTTDDGDLYYVNCTDGLAVREKPTTSSTALTRLYKNTVVVVLEREFTEANGYKWDKVKLANGIEGYVASKWLTFKAASTKK